MEFRVLGPLQVVSAAGAEIDLGGRNQRAVLAMLLSSRRRPISTDRIVDTVWGDRLPADPRNTVQHYVSRLRRVLRDETSSDEVIERVDEGYILSVPNEAIDADRFLDAVRSARRLRQEGSSETAMDLLNAALGEWRGCPYEGLDVDALQMDVHALDEARLDAIEDLVDIRLGLGAHRECVADLERLVEEHPFRERFWAQLMVALYRSGRQAEALRAYQRARRHLVESLGLEPGADLRTIEERILTGETLSEEPKISTPLSVKRPGGRLPVPRTRFVGRTDTLVVVESVLEPGAVATILGASGTGKTRLAIEVGSRAAGTYPDGVCFVALDGVGDADSVARVIAAVVGLSEDPRRRMLDTLADYLARLDALVILDGCERVADACTELLNRTRTRPCRATFLVTSTVMLGTEGEIRIDLPPMGDAGRLRPDEDGVDLFVDRARLLVPGWTPTPAERESIGEIVGAVDGSPLGIELAAARIDTRSVADIAYEILRGAGARGVGSSGKRVRSTIHAEWGVAQLTERERDAFERLSVFVQGFDHEAGQRIALSTWNDLDVDHYLTLLARRSLLRVDRFGDRVRYVMPPALRDAVWPRLRERHDGDGFRAAHAAWYADLAQRADRELRGPNLERWVRVLDRERANIRAALDWSVEANRSANADRLAAGLCRYWDWTGRLSEATHWVDRVLDQTSGHDSWARTWVAIWAVYFATESGQIETALRLADEAIHRAQASEDRDQMTAAWGNRGIVHRSDGDLTQARDDGLRALQVAESGASPWFRAWAESALAVTHNELGHTNDARVLAERSLGGFRRLGDRASEAWSLDLLARLSAARGDLEEAERLARHALLNSHLLGARRNLASAVHTLALIARDRSDMGSAVSLVSAASGLTDHDPSSSKSALLAITAAAAHQLGPSRYTAAWERGRTLDLETLLAG